jgi:ATP-dependent helicase HrpB
MRSGNRLVLSAPTGSGKTTQVPQMLLDSGLAGSGKIVVLQPRRVAARSVAARVAWERNCRLGGEVGYQVRFDDQTTNGTRISYITEGILLRWLQDDPELRDTSIILFDEFHERNLLSDVALALVKRLQETARPDLKFLVMSATLDVESITDYLSTDGRLCPSLVSEGTLFPVVVKYLDVPDERPVSDQAADAVEQIVNSGEPGDILVFMPGMAEINSTIGAIRAARTNEKLALLPLHGDLPAEDQDLAFAPNSHRKLVVSTNVAETSVTIDGVRHVIDSGLARVARYDAERGIGTLMLEPISRASADQRRGRAGRTAPGTCYRLWTESGQLNRPERNTPEIQRSDLAEVVLLLHSLGVRRAAEFPWLDKPDPEAVQRAEELLHTLGALRLDATAKDSDLTGIGRKMLRLPMHPRYSRMLVEASKYGCVPAAAMCAALVSGRDLLLRVGRDDHHIKEARELFEGSQESDFHTLMRAFQFARQSQFNVERCRRYGIHAQTARQVEQTFDQIMYLAKNHDLIKEPPIEGDSQQADPLPRCIMTGFADQLCLRRSQGTLECDMAGGRQGTLMRESVVQQAPMFVVATVREVEGRGASPLTLLGLATAVKPEWLEETFPEQIETTVQHLYDRTHKRVAAVKLDQFKGMVIRHEHQREVDPEASGRALALAYSKEYFELPLFNHEIKQLISRLRLAHYVVPELELPIFDQAQIIEILGNAFSGLTLAKEAQATPLRDAFLKSLAPGQEQLLNELAPLSVTWHDGRRLKLLYPEEAVDEDNVPNSPELQVKLHECFALQEHPSIFEGRLPVRLWLCTPEGKRLEATFNWPAFKANTYPKLKPQLQRKYPGTPWI